MKKNAFWAAIMVIIAALGMSSCESSFDELTELKPNEVPTPQEPEVVYDWFTPTGDESNGKTPVKVHFTKGDDEGFGFGDLPAGIDDHVGAGGLLVRGHLTGDALRSFLRREAVAGHEAGQLRFAGQPCAPDPLTQRVQPLLVQQGHVQHLDIRADPMDDVLPFLDDFPVVAAQAVD